MIDFEMEKRNVRGLSKSPHSVSGSIDDKILELQLKMATCSVNHEYARIEYDDTDDRERQEDLLDFMNNCHEQYLEARDVLVAHDPMALEEFEADLLRQKQSTLSAHRM